MSISTTSHAPTRLALSPIRVTSELLELPEIASAEPEPDPVLKQDQAISPDPGLDLPNAVQVHNRATMDSDEPGRVELGLHLRQGSPNQVTRPTGMKPDIVVG